MKKIIAIGSIALLVSACGSRTIVIEKESATTQPVVEETTTTEVVVRTTQETRQSKEEAFLSGVTFDFPSEVATLGKVVVLEMGRLTCGAIDEGTTIDGFVEMANNAGVDAAFIGALIREAVWNFCPENQWFIDSALNSGA